VAGNVNCNIASLGPELFASDLPRRKRHGRGYAAKHTRGKFTGIPYEMTVEVSKVRVTDATIERTINTASRKGAGVALLQKPAVAAIRLDFLSAHVTRQFDVVVAHSACCDVGADSL
jgi:hypothetical protein